MMSEKGAKKLKPLNCRAGTCDDKNENEDENENDPILMPITHHRYQEYLPWSKRNTYEGRRCATGRAEVVVEETALQGYHVRFN